MSVGKWAHLGHRQGECWVDETHHFTYVHIPKNASSFVKGCLIGARGFWKHSETLINGKENLIVLRDPIDRWCSGIAQYEYNIKSLLDPHTAFETITFDDHTELQTYFLKGVDLSCATFMLVDDNLRSTLSRWIIEHGYVTNIEIAHAYNTSEDDKLERKNYYIKLLEQDPSLVLKLKEHFAEDYKLIKSVKFL